MVTKEEATALVERRLETYDLPNDRAVIVRVDEHPWGWMFLYESENHLRTGNISYALAGNCPLFVTREDGTLHDSVTSSAFPSEEHLRQFEGELQRKR